MYFIAFLELIAVLTSAVGSASKHSLVVLCTVSGQAPCSVARRQDQGLDEVSTAILGDVVGENVEFRGVRLLRVP